MILQAKSLEEVASAYDKVVREKNLLRAALLEIKQGIEHSQSQEIRGGFTVNRPMAEIAQYYAVACSALVELRNMEAQPS